MRLEKLTVLIAIAVLTVAGAGAAYSVITYNGSVSSPYTQSTMPGVTASASGAGIANATSPVTCTATPNQTTKTYTVACPALAIWQGSSYTITVQVTKAQPGTPIACSSPTGGAACPASTPSTDSNGNGSLAVVVTPNAAKSAATFQFTIQGP